MRLAAHRVALAVLVAAVGAWSLSADYDTGRRLAVAATGWAVALTTLAGTWRSPFSLSGRLGWAGLGAGLALSRLPVVNPIFLSTLLTSLRALGVLAGLAATVQFALLCCGWRRTGWVWAPPAVYGALLVARFWLAPDGTGVLAVFVNTSGALLMAAALALVLGVALRDWIRTPAGVPGGSPGAWLLTGLALGLGPVTLGLVIDAVFPGVLPGLVRYGFVTLLLLPPCWLRAARQSAAVARLKR